ncbi:hypothetical protein EMCRGX_G018229 [Ephydatia muelleri]
MEECYIVLLAVVTAATVSFMEDKSVLHVNAKMGELAVDPHVSVHLGTLECCNGSGNGLNQGEIEPAKHFSQDLAVMAEYNTGRIKLLIGAIVSIMMIMNTIPINMVTMNTTPSNTAVKNMVAVNLITMIPSSTET